MKATVKQATPVTSTENCRAFGAGAVTSARPWGAAIPSRTTQSTAP